MKSAFRELPVAWLQLSHGRTKLLAAVVGIVFADLLMWMQLGFLGAAIDSATYIYGRLRGELVVLNPLSHQINSAEPFTRRHLARAQGHVDVEAVAPLYTGTVRWKDPWTGEKRPLFIYGIVPFAPAFAAEGVLESSARLHAADTCLFDIRSRREFAGVAAKLAAGAPVAAEVNGRRIKAMGYSDGYLQRVVLDESLILSVLGYVPGALLAWLLYAFTVGATNLPMRMTLSRGVTILLLTVVMCGLSGLLAMRKLRQADPADVF